MKPILPRQNSAAPGTLLRVSSNAIDNVASPPPGSGKRRAPPDISHFDKLPNSAQISIQALAVVNGQGVSTLWRNCKEDPDFPRPIRLSPGCTRFNVGDIRAYLLKKADTSARPVRKRRLKGQVAI